LWQDCVYKKSDVEEWQKQECLLGECPECGVNILPLCPSEMVMQDTNCFEDVLKQELLGKHMMGNLGSGLNKSSRKLQQRIS
jgi:hypothetical protein